MSSDDTLPRDAGAAPVPALVLAAGLSRRAGPVNKLLIDVDGRPMVAVVAERVLAAGYAPVLVVTGFEAARVEAALSGLDVVFVRNPDFEDGMASSIRHGVGALAKEAAGVLIALGDMPWVAVATLAALRADVAADAIRRPVMDGRPGNPVLFGRRFFAELAALDGDRGAKSVIRAHTEAVRDVTVNDPGIFRDLDQPQS
jgi:molybdenum cofactor cytidylyltransferase